MKLTEAIFAFDTGVVVSFLNLGKQRVVIVSNRDESVKPVEIPNKLDGFNGHEYKPCETHARKIIDLVVNDKPKQTRAEKRAEYAKKQSAKPAGKETKVPGLRIVK